MEKKNPIIQRVRRNKTQSAFIFVLFYYFIRQCYLSCIVLSIISVAYTGKMSGNNSATFMGGIGSCNVGNKYDIFPSDILDGMCKQRYVW